MNSSTSYFVFWMIVYLFAGWVVYALDRRGGKYWYRRWYDFSHEIPLPDGTERGFVGQQPAKQRCKFATVLSVFFTLVLAFFSETTLLSKLTIFLVGIPVITLGLMTAPMVLKLWGKREDVFKTIDSLEAGEVKPMKSVRHGWGKVTGYLSERWEDLLGWWFGPNAAGMGPSASVSSTEPTPPVVLKDESSRVSDIDILGNTDILGQKPEIKTESPAKKTAEEMMGVFTDGGHNNDGKV